MNVCALDVVTRAADFETVAATLELRGWEWDFLHAVDGEATLGDLARRSGIDIDSAIGFVHEAMHRGLVAIPTMTLETYRLRVPTQTALRGASAALSLGTSALAEPPQDLAAPTPATGAISFSSDAFDWNAPEPSFDEPDDSADLAVAHETPGGVHYDDRFGVEHPGGPFATTHQHDAPFSIESHHEEDPFAIASHPEDDYVTAPNHPHEAAFAVTAGHDVEPLVAPAHFDDEPFVPMAHQDEPVAEGAHHDVESTFDPFATAEHHDEPFAVSAHHDEPVAEPVAPQVSQTFDPFAVVAEHHDDPFAVAAEHHDDPFAVVAEHHDDPFAAAPQEYAPSTNGTSLNGHTPVRFDELFADAAPEAAVHDEPVVDHHASTNGVSSNGHASYAYVSDNHVSDNHVVENHIADAPAFDDAPSESPDVLASESHAIDTHAIDAHAIDAHAIDTHAVAMHATVVEHEEAPPHDDTPGSISFSFSADDPSGAHETFDVPGDREAPEVWTPPVAHVAEPAPQIAAATPEPVKAQAQPEPFAKAEPAADPRLNQTQSLYFEREAIDTDAGRELEAKVKNWKDSLSWREQQELNEAIGTGTEKAGVIGSLLRALGVR